MTFVSWVTPLLDVDPIELFVLTHHTQRAPSGVFMLYRREEAKKKTGRGILALQEIVRKLNGLAYMYELEVAAGLIA